MKVVHVVEELALSQTGIVTFVDALTSGLQELGVPSEVISVGTSDVHLDSRVQVTLLPATRFGSRARWSCQLPVALSSAISGRGAILHLHGVWKAPQLLGALVSRWKGRGFVWSPHGMLQEGLWGRSTYLSICRKTAYWHTVAKPALAKCTAHAITDQEQQAIRARLSVEATTIPSSIRTDLARPEVEESYGDHRARRYFLFLGRLHPVKGVGIMLKAFHAAKLDARYELLVAGPPEDAEYAAYIDALVVSLGLSDRVRLLGPIRGVAKYRLLREAWVTIVPSYSEVVGYVNLESGLCRTPTITTHRTGLTDWDLSGGVLVDPTVEGLRAAFVRTAAWSLDERESRGSRLRQLIHDKYSWRAVSGQWLSLYRAAARPQQGRIPT